MSDLSRFSICAKDDLLQSFDQLIDREDYSNRSEAFRDIMRDELIKSQIEESSQTGETLGTLTLVYDHHANYLSEKMSAMQHQYYNLIVSVLYVHVNHDDCLAVIVLRGEFRQIRSIAESLLTLRGVKHGKLFVTLPTESIIEHSKNSSAHSHHHSHPH